jgi:MFS family permease
VAGVRALRTLAPLRHRRFRLLTAGQVTSNVGDACYAVALPWYVLADHGSAVLLGMVLVAYGIPRTALLAVGGYASDRWRPQTVMLASDLARALAVAALAVTAAVGPARAIVLLPIAVVLGAGEGLFLPGSFAILPSLLPGEDLQAGNALASSGTQLAALAGPVIGGALIALAGPPLAFALDAFSFTVSAMTLAGLRAVPPAPSNSGATPELKDKPTPTLRAMLRSERVLPVILLVNIAANLGLGGMDEVALPALAHGPLHADAGGYGTMLAALGGGALLGTFAAGQVRHARPVITGSLAFLVGAACMAVVPYLDTTLAVAAAMAGIGMMNGFGNVQMITVFQQWAPPSMLGQLAGLLALTSFGMFPVSAALAALVVRDLRPAAFFPLAAAALTIAILAGLSQRAWRDFGTGQQAQTAPAADIEDSQQEPSADQR